MIRGSIRCYASFLKTRLKTMTRHGFILFVIGAHLLAGSAYAYNPYSTKELEELEKQFIELINQSDSVVRQPLAKQYINHLGKRLAQFEQMPTPYFFIVKSNEINAFAGPGGYIGINTQLILATDNEDELAAVMAHEIAHVRLHHLYSMIQHQKQMRIPMLASLLASIALGIINPTLASGAMMASLNGFAQDSINFTRSNEKQADRIGINMLIKSGLNPRGMAAFFKKMQSNSRYYYTANIPAILRTHPLDEDRIAEAENRSSRLKKRHYPDSPDYRLFKELIRNTAVENSKQLLDYYQKECRRTNGDTACRYGHALALMHINQFKEAQSLLGSLLGKDTENVYFQLAMAEAETGNKQFDAAMQRLQNLQTNYPENYAVIMISAQGFLVAGQPDKAVGTLLRGFRQFKHDLPLCETLAQAQSAARLKSYAYFTQSQCYLLQGRSREALRQLQVAGKLAGKDHYLQARIAAMIEEVKFQSDR
ncbi:Zn-dependent protease [Legionella spiritensis]|nr:Zn-dependent protease [Legionella spiritensis]